MNLETRLRRLESRIAPAPDQTPGPHCTCFSVPPTFRNQEEMRSAQQQECPRHGPRFRFCLVAPITLSEDEWRARQARLSRPVPSVE